MQTPSERRLVAALSAALVALLLNGLWAGTALRSLIDAARWNTHTFEVLAQIGRCRSLQLTAGSGVRAYLLTGSAADLAAYDTASAAIWSAVAHLQLLTQDNAAQQRRIEALHGPLEARLQLLAESVELRARGDADDAARRAAAGRIDTLGAQVEALFAAMESEENRLLAVRAPRTHRDERAAFAALAITNLVALAFLAAIWALSHRVTVERTRHEDELQREKEWLATTLGSIGDGVVATDTHGVVRFINAVTARLTGWGEEEAVGRPVGEVFHIVNEHHRGAVENPAFRALREGLVVGLANHTLLLSRNGEETPIDDSAAPIRSPAGATLGVVLVFRDVSERKRVETEREQLLATERQARREAESASRARDSFLATVSHELRTPLGAILGWAGILRSTQPDAATVARAAEVIERNARSQAKIVDDILDLARIVAGKLKLQLAAVNPVELVAAAVESQRPAARAKEVQLEMSSADVGAIFADADRLQQIVWNLLSNAIKFSTRGGLVDVRVERHGDRVHIVVADQGIGISAERLPRVFERFWQADDGTPHRSQGGLGLGLAIVRQLAEIHGGSVGVESPGEGRGATFTVIFPVRSPGELADARRAARAGLSLSEPLLLRQGLRGRRILVVDDEPDHAEWAAELLRAAGAEVRLANSAREGFAALLAWRPELLISDIGMPEEDGLAFMKRIRALPAAQGGQTVGLALTAYASSEDRVKALSVGFHMHTPKPVDAIELLLIAASLLDRAS